MTETIQVWVIGTWFPGAAVHLCLVLTLAVHRWRNRGIRDEGPPVQYWPMGFRPFVAAGVVVFWPILVPVALVLGYALLFGKDLLNGR